MVITSTILEAAVTVLLEGRDVGSTLLRWPKVA
jgi:hypothetical protein